MIILSDYFYKVRLEKEEYKIVSNPTNINDNRFYPARSFEVFPVWLDYINKNYPNDNIVFFDNFSEIPFEEAMDVCGITDYKIIQPNSYNFDIKTKIHIKRFNTQYEYLHAVQRQRVEALKFAYINNIDYFWIDTDYLVNSDVKKYLNCDVFSPFINHYQQTIDAQFIFISKHRLHEYDPYFNIIDFYEDILNNAPDNKQSVRHMTMFEGGMYKMFCFGNIKTATNLNLSHSACYNNFLKWLKHNHLDTKNYKKLLELLENINKEKLKNKNVLFDFNDVFEIEK